MSRPTTVPEAVVSAPPESPEMSAALVASMPPSVSEVPSNWSDAVTDRPTPVIVPDVTVGVPPVPPALPTA